MTIVMPWKNRGQYVLYNIHLLSFNTYLELAIASYSFVGYNIKTSLLLNAVALSLQIMGVAFKWVWLAKFLRTEPPSAVTMVRGLHE